jgi:hypothetical protein
MVMIMMTSAAEEASGTEKKTTGMAILHIQIILHDLRRSP